MIDHSQHPILQANTTFDAFSAQVAAQQDKVATVFHGRQLTYGQLGQRVAQVAEGLERSGIAHQKRFAYLGLNSDHYLELFFGAAMSGRILIPVNWRLAPPEVAYILQDCEAELLFVDPDFLSLAEEVKDECPALRQIYLMDGNTPGYDTYETWRDGADGSSARHEAGPDDVLVQMYTSGTTGFPKGALLTHQSLLAAISKGKLVNQDWSDWDETDISLMAMPCFHVGGTVWGFQTLCNGGTCVILDKPDIAQIIHTIDRQGITKMFAVPAVLLTILDHPDTPSVDLSSMQEVFYGASPIPPVTLKRAMETFGCSFIQYYGMTEVSGSITYLPPEDHDVAGTPRMASCGKPFPNVEIRVADDHGQDVEIGKVGEILIRTDSIMKGYWNRQADTEAAFFGDWYRSGDAGYVDEGGYVYLFDRVKDMIVSGAENIYPAEVEAALMDHPAVADTAVIGVPDERWGEAVKAIIVKKGDATADDIIAFTRTKIAGYKVPKSIDFVKDLPRNPSGKILKKELRKAYWPEGSRKVG
ncbi:MAG: long-chain-fatty-acid--CoA ligase [Pseudomonadota bacterium]